MNRRNFIKTIGLATTGLLFPFYSVANNNYNIYNDSELLDVYNKLTSEIKNLYYPGLKGHELLKTVGKAVSQTVKYLEVKLNSKYFMHPIGDEYDRTETMVLIHNPYISREMHHYLEKEENVSLPYNGIVIKFNYSEDKIEFTRVTLKTLSDVEKLFNNVDFSLLNIPVLIFNID